MRLPRKPAGRSNRLPTRPLRIGIYGGAFDPVHAGHISFALQALQTARLDQVIFLPERRPQGKPGVEHYAHRVAMLKKALLPHPDLAVLETVERYNTVRRTLPQLRGLLPGAELVFLLGSDVALSLPQWPHAKQLLDSCELAIGIREGYQADEIEAAIRAWTVLPASLTIINSFAPDVSSSKVRDALRSDGHTNGLLDSVRRYARQEWLYVSPGTINV